MTSPNRLFYGDCLDVMRTLPASHVDLVYLDPPFNSRRDYNAFFSSQATKDANAQVMAFEDTWQWGEQAQREYDVLLRQTGTGALGEYLLPALRSFLGNSDLMAYLVMMASRLVEIKRLMKDTASIYLHCDPTASHYLKLLMDAIFGKANFRNEIVWIYSRMAAKGQKQLSRCHDTILWYCKGKTWTFNVDDIRQPYAQSSKAREGYKKTSLGGGRPKSEICELNPLGKFPEDWWQIPFLRGAERLGYPTQKPLPLLERIVLASSNPGDIVLDPFCGCGTALHAAQKLNRCWIGIDITHLAIGLIKQRLLKAFPDCQFTEWGSPADLASARHLAQSGAMQGRYEFQYWALMLAGALPSRDKKKGADGGIDGYIWFYDSPDPGAAPRKMIFSVKSGKIPASHIRELAGLLGEQTVMAALLTLDEPGAKMRADALAYGQYIYPNGKSFPKIQLITVKDLLDGVRPQFLDYGEGRAMNRQASRERRQIRQGALDSES